MNFSLFNDISPTPTSLHSKLVPVHYRECKHGLLLERKTHQSFPLDFLLKPTVKKDKQYAQKKYLKLVLMFMTKTCCVFLGKISVSVKDNLFSYKIPEVTLDMIDVLVVIKIQD